RSVTQGNLLSFSAAAQDSDIPTQVLTYSLDSGGPKGAAINSATGLFTWVPSIAQGPGSYTVTIRVVDSGTPSRQASQTIVITVLEPTELMFFAGITNGPPGTQVPVPIQVLRFMNLNTFQYSLHWD